MGGVGKECVLSEVEGYLNRERQPSEGWRQINVAAQTGDFSMKGSIRLIASGEKAMVTMAMYRQNASLPTEMTDVYMSMQLH